MYTILKTELTFTLNVIKYIILIEKCHNSLLQSIVPKTIPHDAFSRLGKKNCAAYWQHVLFSDTKGLHFIFVA